MKISKIVLIFVMILMYTLQVYGEVPYQSLYYDGESHPYNTEKITLKIDGVVLDDSSLPMKPINIDGSRILVPLREVLEALGATVNFDSATNSVTVLEGKNTVVVAVGSTTGYINGEALIMDAEPKYVSVSKDSEKKIMIPLRFVSEGLGFKVVYEADTKTVVVDKPKEVEQEVEQEVITDGHIDNVDEITEEVLLREINSTEIEAIDNNTARVNAYTLPTLANKTFVLKFDTDITNVKKRTLIDGRLILDVENSVIKMDPINEDVGVGSLANVRIAQFELEPTPITRAVLTFDEESTYTINISEDRRILTVTYEYTNDVPVAPKDGLNAVSMEVSLTEETDIFTLVGESEPPELYGVTELDEYTFYIDILKPNTILENVENNFLNGTISGVAVSSYRMYELSDTTTRLEVNTSKKSIINVIKNGNLTKIYIKPTEEVIIEDGNIIVESNGALTIESSETKTVVTINKSLTTISPFGESLNINHLDDYMTSRYYLTIPVSLQYTIPSQNLPIDTRVLKSFDILNDATSTQFVFNGEKPLDVEVTEDSEKIVFTVKLAKDVYDKIIVIDPGHGGTDPGTKGTYNGVTYYEKDVVFDIGTQLTNIISSNNNNYKVYMTRTTDVFVPLYDRPGFSTNINADLFISIHADAAGTNNRPNSVPNGITTYYCDINQVSKEFLEEKEIVITEEMEKASEASKNLGELLHKNLISTTLLTDRSTRHGNYAVLRGSTAPSILVETGFMTNQRDLLNIIDPAYRTKVANSMANSVIDYLNQNN